MDRFLHYLLLGCISIARGTSGGLDDAVAVENDETASSSADRLENITRTWRDLAIIILFLLTIL